MKRPKDNRGTLKPSHYRLCDRLNDLARNKSENWTLRGFQYLKWRWTLSFQDVRRK